MAKKKRGFTPFVQPAKPPAGTYDPALDAAVRASGRGFQDLQLDTSTGLQRNLSDYTIGQGNINEQRTNSLADLLRSYTQDTQDRQKQYQTLASNQQQSANAAGLLGGSFTPQATAKRNANQALEQGRADTAYNTSVGRVNTGADEALAQLGLQYQRGVEDANTNLSRAGRENTFFGADTTASEWAQAKGSGLPLPQRPANEGSRVTANGSRIYYRRQPSGGAMLTNGRVLSASALRAYLRRKGVR